ncbi:hypothetical protein [Nocardioides solisilvae]|uniref:hypothetical protein n=1 Tax=Nocardioides solisilvae TaxID=1542435 RepID=UPI001EF6B2B8|nr:hypothetical protein [Nocardioides solisilvae]
MSEQTPSDDARHDSEQAGSARPDVDPHDVDPHDVDQRDVDQRAELLPEEQAVGSEDPEAQARVILEESAERTDDPSGTRAESTQTLGEDAPGTEPRP